MSPAMERLRAVLDSLKLRLTVSAIAALAVGMGVVALLVLRQTEHDTISSQRRMQMSETVRVAQILSHRVTDLQRALQVTAAQLDPDTLGDPQRLRAFIRSQPVLNAMFSSVFVSSSSGRMLLFSQADAITEPSVDLSDRPYVRDTLAQARPLVSDPMVSRVTGDAILVFTYPLQHSGGVFGLLAGTLHLTSRELVADLVEPDDSGSLLAVADTTGRLLAHPEHGLVLTSVASLPRFNEAFKAWVDAGSAVEPAGISLPQAREVVSAAGVPGTEWVVWRAVPEQDLLAPLRGARSRATLLVCVLLAVMSLVLFVLLAWLLRPLAQLERRAAHLFDGKQNPQEGWPPARGELGQLARVLRHVGAERAQLEEFNDQVMKKLLSVMSSAPIGIAFTRAQRFELVSTELCRLLGRAEHELLGQPVESIYVDRAHYLKTLEDMDPAFNEGRPYTGEWQMRRADGSAFCAQLRGRPVDLQQGGSGTIWTVSDVSDQVASRELLEWSATHDSLTGLSNRSVLEQRLTTIFAARAQSPPSAVVAIDLDHFKPINDSAGHAAGDEMLRAVAQAITSRVRGSDLVVRLGGDEFALLLEGCPSTTALRIANDVRAAIADVALPWEGKILRVGASLGVADLRIETESVQAWLAEADAACYEVKRAGRGAVRSAALQVA